MDATTQLTIQKTLRDAAIHVGNMHAEITNFFNSEKVTRPGGEVSAMGLTAYLDKQTALIQGELIKVRDLVRSLE